MMLRRDVSMWGSLIALVVFLAVPSSPAYAEPPVTLFQNVSTVSTGSIKRSEASEHTVDCTFTNTGGTVTALSVGLKGSIDGDTVETLATHTFSAAELSAKKAMFHVVNKPVGGVAGSMESVTKTGSIYLGCKYKAHRYLPR